MGTMGSDIAIFLTKARESLSTAESEFANGRFNSCANRCYYACYQAAIAALLHEGIRPRGQWSHESVQAQFVGQLVNRRKRYGAELRRVLSDNLVLRGTADYHPEYVSQIQANRALNRSRSFVRAVIQTVGDNA
jgi:uncharacterized protein (UPF0332 family)